MYRKVLAVLLTCHLFLIRSTNLFPLSNSSMDTNHILTKSRVEPRSKNNYAIRSAVRVATANERNHAEGRTFPRTVPRLVYPAAKMTKYRPANAHRPPYSQQYPTHPAYSAQERYQPIDVGNKPRRPSSQYQLQPPNLPSSIMQNTEIRPSQPSDFLESDSPKATFPADFYVPQPSPGISAQSNNPSDTKPKTPPKQPSMNDSPPSTGLIEDSYNLSPPKHPYYHHTKETPLQYNLQDNTYVDYDPNSQEHESHTHDHLHYHHSFSHIPPPESTYELIHPTPRPEENRNQKPYTYYYIGRKLWYIPMYFSAYFIVYITALLVKYIARHKIKYPLSYWASRSLGNGGNKGELELVTEIITKALATTEHRYT